MDYHREIPILDGHAMDVKESDAKRKGSTRRQLIAEDERGDINELANTFIKNFYNQLKIQRNEPIKH